VSAKEAKDMADKEWQGPLEKIDDFRWRIPRSHRADMRTDCVVYGSETLVQQMRKDNALEQLVNVSTLPGIVGNALVMPDAHWGYGFPIGGVAAFDAEEGVVSPGGIGYDINCGVRLLRTDLTKDDVLPKIEPLVNQLFRDVPSGTGSEGLFTLADEELEEVTTSGAQWAIKKGLGMADDERHTEASGHLPADPTYVSQRARDRGRPQIGTLGSGNHFLEIQVVDYVYDEKIARAFGIENVGQVTVMVHCGSRGFGHQVCTDFLQVMQQAVQKYGIALPDRQLACCPLASEEAERYLKSMNCAANYAFANRQVIIHNVRRAFERVLGKSPEDMGMRMVYDVAHNIGKFEEYEVNGVRRKVFVHRKGATRAFGAGNPEIHDLYRAMGQPVIVPGDMGTYSFLLAGTKTAEAESFGSTCHGAGRQLSRKAAVKRSKGSELVERLKEQGITLKARSLGTVAEEAPYAYKDVSEVVDSCHGAGIAVKVARLKPIGVVKG
jgi:tRNA-splicing ligase RtcB